MILHPRAELGYPQPMKLHQLGRGIFFEHEPSLTLGCKRLRPLAPKLHPNAADTLSSFDLKSFIRPQSGPRKLSFSDDKKDSPHQVEKPKHPGGTRWNPTQEQIRILEMLYRGGIRTPNAQQIEHITAQLGQYGKIEGKNVFYWFQNHKARERQKQKCNSLVLANCGASAPQLVPIISFETRGDLVERVESPYKKCRSWPLESLEEESSRARCKDEEEEHRTLELFPLHPKG